MNDIVDVWMRSEDFVEPRFVGDFAVVEFRPFAADQFDAPEDFRRGVVEIVNNDYFVVSFEERERSEGADIACASSRLLASKREWQQPLDFRTYPVTSTEPTTISRMCLAARCECGRD